MLACRQRHEFRIEEKYGGKKYAGGRNDSTVADIAIIISGQLPIRTHDFLYPRNWLDILKCIVYYSSFWVTLSIVLLAGCHNTTRVSAFSLGYLMSSFLLCYIGTNFYKKPIRSILRWWNLLIAFNVLVIAIKSILNMRLIVKGALSAHQMLASVHTFLSEVGISMKKYLNDFRRLENLPLFTATDLQFFTLSLIKSMQSNLNHVLLIFFYFSIKYPAYHWTWAMIVFV